jgi:hypothetical protein
MDSSFTAIRSHFIPKLPGGGVGPLGRGIAAEVLSPESLVHLPGKSSNLDFDTPSDGPCGACIKLIKEIDNIEITGQEVQSKCF